MRGRSRRKAISPIIATLILIVITVVAGVMLYGFVTGFMAKTSSSTGAISTLAIDAVGISQSATTWQVNVTVTNTGNTPVTITQVNLLNATTGALMYSYTESTPITVPAGKTMVINAFSPGTISSSLVGNPTIVQVITSTGSYAEESAVIGP
ncbi:MAG: archaellin/type IV pilin N-terminal domain-containing protein [Nitrososphaeria archaeon]